MSYLTEEEFIRHLNHIDLSPVVAVDTEGTLNHPFAKTWGVSTSAQGISEYFAFHHELGENLPLSWLPKLKKCLENHPCLIFHNAKHDLRSLKALGIDYQNKFYDTMLMSHMVDENRYSQALDSLSKSYGGQPKKSTDLMKRIIELYGWEGIPSDLMREYGADDAWITEELFYKLKPEFDAEFDEELWEWEQKFVRLLIKIENQGVLIDRDLSERELARGLSVMGEIEQSLGFNPGSSIQLGRFLLNDLGMSVVERSKTTGNPSFNKKAMEEYDRRLSLMGDSRAQQVLTYRGWAKTTSSNYKAYLELMLEDGRVHPNYKMHGTTTGRLSCEKPNLQQIPRSSENDWNGQLKKVFLVDQGRTAHEFDYAQLEFRLVAAYGKEQKLIDIFNEDRNIFTEMAYDLDMLRDHVKTQVYLIQYGGGPKKLSETLGLEWDEANKRIQNYYRTYPGIAKINEIAKKRCLQNGYVKYWTGRRRHFRYPKDEYYKSLSALIQGGAFEIVKRQMIALDEAGLNNEECAIDLQVHDSVRADIEEGKEHIYLPEIKRVMEDVQPDFGVKFKVDSKKWGSK